MMSILLVLFFASIVKSEGYYCPYEDLGATSENQLLYDYYYDNDGTFWTRKGETGWMTVETYCSNKGDTSLHSDAGEWKCNDSHLLCIWDGSSCKVNTNRVPDCKELCQAVLNNGGPECLGNCAGGRSSNTLYSKYCEPTVTNDNKIPNKNETEKHNDTQNTNRKRRKCRKKLP
jgi:hypothetical protein